MDASTGAECAEIAAAAGGNDKMVALTGSVAIERFTGPQIRKFAKDDPAGYERTAEIHLVSSFVASLLTGTSVPIDFGDGAGMNLLDLARGAWSPQLLDATAPNLGRKLKPAVPSATYAGVVADYFVKRYGFAANTPVIAFTGDNPSSLVGMGATEPGTAVVSLGTSDTMFAAMAAPRTDPKGYGNVFGNPAGGFMALCCFSNGSLAREEVAKRCNLGWDEFARAILEQTRPGNGGDMLLPYFVPEITPRLPAPAPRWFGSADFVAGKNARRRRPRRGRGSGAVDAPALGLHRPAARTASWSRAARRRTPASCGCSRTRSRPRSCRCGSPTPRPWAARCARPRPSRASPGATFTPVSRRPTSTDASRLTGDQK